MATASSTRTAPAAVLDVRRAVLRYVLPVAAIVGVAGLLFLIYHPWYLNYDARYALLWARDLSDGFSPDYEADFAPTPHPLQTAVSFLLLPFGEAADDLLVWLVLVSLGALAWFAYRLGAELFSPWVGAVTALVVLTRPALQRDALLAYQDIPFAALILLAVLLEARRPRRGALVLVVLAFAGLLRPEAWFLSALYLLYLWRERPRPTGVGIRLSRADLGLLALAAAAPLVWALSDLLVTGDLLHSLHGTAELAEEADRRRHITQVPYWTAQYFGFTLREPLVLGVPIGLAFAWLYRRRAAALPVAVAVVMTAVFAIGPLFGLPLIGRYIRTPAVLLALFYGLAVCGWLLLPPGRARRVWLGLGLFAVASSLAFLPKQVRMLDGLEQRVSRDRQFYGDLRDVGRAAAVREAFERCSPLSAADHRPIPYLRWWLDGPPGSVGTVEKRASPLGQLFLAPRSAPVTRRFYRKNFPRVPPPAGYRLLYQNRSWRVWVAAGCQTRRVRPRTLVLSL